MIRTREEEKEGKGGGLLDLARREKEKFPKIQENHLERRSILKWMHCHSSVSLLRAFFHWRPSIQLDTERERGGPREKRRNAILKSRHEHKSLTRRFLKREALPSSLTPPPSLVEPSLEGRNAVCLHAIALKKEETQNAKAP